MTFWMNSFVEVNIAICFLLILHIITIIIFGLMIQSNKNRLDEIKSIKKKKGVKA